MPNQTINPHSRPYPTDSLSGRDDVRLSFSGKQIDVVAGLAIPLDLRVQMAFAVHIGAFRLLQDIFFREKGSRRGQVRSWLI